jgi:hypothetical protein
MINNHLDRHTATPDTGQAFGNVGSSIEPAVASLTIRD